MIPCVDVLLFSASDFAVELLLWVTSPDSPPQHPVPPTETGVFVFDWTPGAEVAPDVAFWSTLFVADCCWSELCDCVEPDPVVVVGRVGGPPASAVPTPVPSTSAIVAPSTARRRFMFEVFPFFSSSIA